MKVAIRALLMLLTTATVDANSWTPFIEDVEVGQVGTKVVELYRSGANQEFEFFTLLVRSDTLQTYAINARAKQGVLKLAFKELRQECKVTGKVLSKRKDKESGQVAVMLEILKVEPSGPR